ncbi:hypothetical protein ACIOAU_15735 [Pseudomonas sp. NPDC088322]|uniref:hypothetical protein n=1 Tax=Pseudomonas sp. NPDC088322 TaxID=3364452 RepID=UPI0038013A43
MSDRDGWHRDSRGNEHFHAHDAEWADREIREKAASSSSSDYGRDPSRNAAHGFQLAFLFLGGVCLHEARLLWQMVEKSMKSSGFSPVTSDRVGMAAGAALLVFGAVLIWKAPGYLAKTVVLILFALIAGYLIF